MNSKVIHACAYVAVCVAFPALPFRGIGWVFKCLGAFLGGMFAELPIPFNPFK